MASAAATTSVIDVGQRAVVADRAAQHERHAPLRRTRA